ncbi:MAG: response regulator [Elusimicrobia bacterium]|nr:response regulator [Elusimicrobiota bacterium]
MLGKLFGMGKPRILVADDEESVRSLVCDLLYAQGYKVESVVDGQEAVKRFKDKKFDLIVLDVHMPRLEGPQALEVIRMMPGGKDVGVIMLTSESSMGTFMQAFELGAITYIAKPFSPAKLLAQVEAYFAKKNGPAQ